MSSRMWQIILANIFQIVLQTFDTQFSNLDSNKPLWVNCYTITHYSKADKYSHLLQFPKYSSQMVIYAKWLENTAFFLKVKPLIIV